MNGLLYLVGTPIGNLGDLSSRAAEILSQVDFIAAEDTRNSQKILFHLGIRKEMVSYHEHNRALRGPQIVERLLAGQSCALITDAGMPAISDPGEDLVRLCGEAGLAVSVVPGPCAAICALALSGLPTDRFVFEGFLPVAASERKKRLEEISRENRTVILYEAPHRLLRTLGELAAMGDRRLCIVKELTKIHETVLRTTTLAAPSLFDGETVRGEFVLVLEGAPKQTESWSDEQIAALLAQEQQRGASRSEAVRLVCAQTNLPKNRVYRLANLVQEKKS